jgi:hypothetical protein
LGKGFRKAAYSKIGFASFSSLVALKTVIAEGTHILRDVIVTLKQDVTN